MSVKPTEQSIDIINETTTISIKKKKGRPRKNPIDTTEVKIDNNIPTEKKKRGRKKKEKVEEEVKQKKKRGRKAAIKFFSSSIRKKIPLTTIIHDNDNSLLHLDIKDHPENKDKDLTYDTLKIEYGLQNKKIYGTSINDELLQLSNRRFDSSDEDNNDDNHEDDDDDDDDILGDYLDKNDNNNIETELSDLYEKRLESRLIQDNNLIKKLEDLHNDENLLFKLINKKNKNDDINNDKISLKNNQESIKRRGLLNILSEFIETNKWLDKTNIACWWCCHTFDTIPIGFPVDYYKDKFRTKGVFCSFACTIAYGKCYNHYNTRTKSMINSLYNKLTGYTNTDLKENYKDILKKDIERKNLFEGDIDLQNEYIESLCIFLDTPLEPAPDKCVLKMFGGELSIEEFRNSTKERKVYKMIEYPMFVSRDYVEEIDINNLKNVNKNVFTKQNVQLTNKLDDNKLNEVKARVNSTVVTTNSGMNRFIKW